MAIQMHSVRVAVKTYTGSTKENNCTSSMIDKAPVHSDKDQGEVQGQQEYQLQPVFMSLGIQIFERGEYF